MKKLILIAIPLCFLASANAVSRPNTKNWCGLYYEQDGQGFIKVPKVDFIENNNNCLQNTYNERLKSGSIVISLDFTHNRSTLDNWRKFNNHLIEVRGKLRYKKLTGIQFIRDIGV